MIASIDVDVGGVMNVCAAKPSVNRDVGLPFLKMIL